MTVAYTLFKRFLASLFCFFFHSFHSNQNPKYYLLNMEMSRKVGWSLSGNGAEESQLITRETERYNSDGNHCSLSPAGHTSAQ